MKLLIFLLLFTSLVHSADYNIGPDYALKNIADAPWATLTAGDTVYIHWRAAPYREKWVINRVGSASQPISIIGVSNEFGQQPVIDGNNAVTVAGLNYWNETRGVIKIGGSNNPADGLPQYIIIENLEIRSARPAYQFTDDNGNIATYSNNAASLFVEKAANLTIRNLTLRDSGNGLFIGANGGQTENILVEGNHIYDNGIVGRFFEHNAYTAAINITYQYNRFGPLRSGALGNNLKDRSAGLVVRYNWIESGNRQLDLVDAEDSSVLVNHPAYAETFVYGNVLIEPNGAGNSQIIHYGGDSGTLNDYRKGNLYLFNNTIISTRSGTTTLLRLSSNDETAHVFNNIIFNTASGSSLAMIDGSGSLNLNNNWLKSGWRDCHCSPAGTVNDNGNNIEASDPLFLDFGNQQFALQSTSAARNSAGNLMPAVLPAHQILQQYLEHQNVELRPVDGLLDMGAFEFFDNSNPELLFQNGFEH
ncbi:MAG: hypothetical protein L3J22_11060 [Xanthomonadales bacterium]|nr:hypothetical protein [Xanthomonadales bacterium]